jgi:hypothetical protein
MTGTKKSDKIKIPMDFKQTVFAARETPPERNPKKKSKEKKSCHR